MAKTTLASLETQFVALQALVASQAKEIETLKKHDRVRYYKENNISAMCLQQNSWHDVLNYKLLKHKRKQLGKQFGCSTNEISISLS